MFLPPARSSRPAEDGAGGLTITEKIKQRRAAGGAESWEEFKERMTKKQQEDNWEAIMSAQHRETLDRERDARLARALNKDADGPQPKRHKSDKTHKEHKDKKHKHKDSKRKKKKEKHKHKDRDKSKKERSRDRNRDESSSSSCSSDDDGPTSNMRSTPVALSEFLAQSSSSGDERE